MYSKEFFEISFENLLVNLHVEHVFTKCHLLPYLTVEISAFLEENHRMNYDPHK